LRREIGLLQIGDDRFIRIVGNPKANNPKGDRVKLILLDAMEKEGLISDSEKEVIRKKRGN
jgi:hypothetical protein